MVIKYTQRALVCVLFLFIFVHKNDANMRICGFKLTATLKAVCRNQVCGGYALETKQKSEFFIFIYSYT